MADPSSPHPDKIFCTEEDVFNLLLALDTTKASGLDGISGRMLTYVAKLGNLLECYAGSFTPGLTQAHCFASTLLVYVHT